VSLQLNPRQDTDNVIPDQSGFHVPPKRAIKELASNQELIVSSFQFAYNKISPGFAEVG